LDERALQDLPDLIFRQFGSGWKEGRHEVCCAEEVVLQVEVVAQLMAHQGSGRLFGEIRFFDKEMARQLGTAGEYAVDRGFDVSAGIESVYEKGIDNWRGIGRQLIEGAQVSFAFDHE